MRAMDYNDGIHDDELKIFSGETMNHALKNNELRFGPGSNLEQLERAKKIINYDSAVGLERLMFIMEVKTILNSSKNNSTKKLKAIETALTKYTKNYNHLVERLSISTF